MVSEIGSLCDSFREGRSLTTKATGTVEEGRVDRIQEEIGNTIHLYFIWRGAYIQVHYIPIREGLSEF